MNNSINDTIIKRRIIIFIAGVIVVFSYVFFIHAPGSAKERAKRISEFTLEFKGIILDKKELDHNNAKCQIKVLESNSTLFEGVDYIGREIVLKDGMVTMTLMRNDCLSKGDTVQVGPHDNFSIRNGKIFYDRNRNIDECYQLGRK